MIKIVGDINFSDGFFDTGFGVGTSVESGHDPFLKLNRNKDDFWIGNFECVASDLSDKQGLYRNQFRISPSDLNHIQHFDIYNVANNHVMQHGPEAYEEMCRYLVNSGVNIVGKLTRKTTRFNYKGKEFGILSFSQREEKYSKTTGYWYNPEYAEIEQEFRNIRDTNFKIGYIHWGNEFINRPYADQVFFAHYLIDLGFDIVIGLHPHVLQGYEKYNGKYIFYSIGNFVFNMPTDATRYAAIVTLDLIDEQLNVSYEYVKIGKDYFPFVVDEKTVPENFRFSYLNGKIYPLVENELYYKHVFKSLKRYRQKNMKLFIKNIFRFKIKDLLDVMVDFFKRRL